MGPGDDAWGERRKWYESEDQYVRRQRALSEERAASADARLRTSIRQVAQEKDALARQLAELGAAFDAFVELTAVRERLAGHAAAATVREQSRALMAALLAAAPDASDAPDAPDAPEAAYADADRLDPRAVPGYWLPYAVAGLKAMLGNGAEPGKSGIERTALESASGCDAQRTALFLALALPLAGAADRAAPWLRRALGPAPALAEGDIPEAVREVWLQAGRGVYGEPGRSAVIDWLASIEPPETVDRLLAAIGAPVTAASCDGDPAALVSRARAAVTALTELARLFSVEPPLDSPPAPAHSAAHPGPIDADEAAHAPSLVLLEALIAEGSPAEAELIARARRLSDEVRKYRTGQEGEPAPRWDAPGGAVFALLEADLREDSPELAGLRAIAQAVLSRTAAQVADRLLAEAPAETSSRFTLRLDGRTLELDADQPLDPQLAALDADVERRYAAEPGHSGRKQVAAAAERIAERKAANRGQAQAALDGFARLRGQLPELRQAALRAHTGLLDRLGRLMERTTMDG